MGTVLPFEGKFNHTFKTTEESYRIPIYLGERYMGRDNFKLIDFKMAVQNHSNPNRKISLKFRINK